MKSFGSVLGKIAGVGLVLYLLACGALFAFQRSLIYYPQPRSDSADSVLLTLPVGTATVNISTRPHSGPSALLYFGGNAEDVSQDISELAEAFPSKAIYALHYPGYGGSSGTPTEQSIFTDALALFDRAYAEHPDVAIAGRSLGSGVAVWVTSQRPATHLILITPFDGLADPAANQFPILPVRWLLRDRFESWRYAPQVKAPTKIIVAAEDELVQRSSSERLRTRFREGLVSYVVVPGVGHNTIQNSFSYWAALRTE